MRPDFNQYDMWSPNHQDRIGGAPAEVIDLLILHTQEGDGNADSLARYLQGNVGVSYHYTVSQAADGGVTVCNVVGTDLASWSVLDANNRSINLCFAGSRAAWTREQWMRQSKAIDAAAYLVVQDCRRYDVPPKVMPPNAYGPPGGITDHAYVTRYLGIGTHTDCGPNFPWDYFAQRVTYWADPKPAPPVPVPPPAPPKHATTLDDLARKLDELNAKIDRLLAK